MGFRLIICILGILFCAIAAWSKQMEPGMSMPGMEQPPSAGMQMAPSMQMQTPMPTNPVGCPMQREGSGTSWMPDSTPMYGLTAQSGKWNIMYHGAAHLAFDNMNGRRGDRKFVIPDWVMAMARQNPTVRDQLRLSLMLSTDPFTVGGGGYPLIFQSGESWLGKPLHDHQHPHNFVSEMSANYIHGFSTRLAGYLYFAPVGEPALGPPTYMHRTFALDDFVAPIGHHWQDSTHVTFGVITLGAHTRNTQLEASVFAGREPGENRYAIRAPSFDSWSFRVSWNPTEDIAAQFSHGYLKSPEELQPTVNEHRTTGSVIYNRQFGQRRNLQSTFVWGRNTAQGRSLDSFLLEADLKSDGGWTPFIRYEHIVKNAEELVLPQFSSSQEFTLRQYTVGIVRDLPLRGEYLWGIGAQVILNATPRDLVSVYGNDPSGWIVFVRVHPKRMREGTVMSSEL